MPASCAMAGRCSAVFDDPPNAMSTEMAFLKASRVMMSLGFRPFLTISMIAMPVSFASRTLAASTAGMVPFPLRAMPSASERQFMEFAVNIPLHDPAPGQAHSSRLASSLASMSPAATLPTPSNTDMRSTGLPLKRPAIIGPPLTSMAGMLRRRAAIIIPGIILSQLGINTRPSKGYALAMTSTESQISSRDPSEYFMPSWFMAIPSQTPIVENSIGVPPAILTPSFTACAILPRCMCPGITSLAELAMPMMGLSSSSFRYPMAPKRLLCGAFCKPFFILSDLMKPPVRQENIAASRKGIND